jgi:hypothetical protein
MSSVTIKSDIDDLIKAGKEENERLLKKKAVSDFRTEADYERFVQSSKEVEALKNINLDSNRDEYVAQIIRENDEYMAAAKNCKTFICKSFDNIVPNFGKNINLIGANTGEGKSTAVANIALQTAMTGGRTLIITNEEAVPDVYNRITCLSKGWIYSNHNEFTDEQKETLRDGVRKLSKFIYVVGDASYGPGTTTTIEGLKGVLESLITNGQKYDSIIIDYIQKVTYSKLSPQSKTWEVLSNVMQYLDGFKNRYLAPIIVMAQLHNSGNSANDDRSFEDRIKGFKGILTPVTCAMEMKADKKTLETIFVIHKNRWYNGDIDGQEVKIGWFKGKFVPRDYPPYVDWVRQKQGERIARTLENENAGHLRSSGNSSADSSDGST